MKFKDFEIRPPCSCFLDGHTDPKKWDVVKWYKTDKPVKVTDAKTGDEKMQDIFCYSVAQIWWNDKEPCWEFKNGGKNVDLPSRKIFCRCEMVTWLHIWLQTWLHRNLQLFSYINHTKHTFLVINIINTA